MQPPPQTIKNTMRCPSCHIENPASQPFCAHCGAAMNEEVLPKLGPYRLEAKLGEGGMGIVYRAMDEQLNREVAIKVLHPQLLKHKELMERFRREARMHAKLIHQNIVTLLSLYEDGEHTALVMEMVHGQNLKDYLRQYPKPKLSDVMRICKAILSGLQAAHTLGMVHRDLKPANVLLADDGSIKLMDFGLAKLEQGDDDLTRSGATVGSFRYMAPEQILNQSVDARTDLYALGIIMYQMCTGRPPFDGSAGGGEFEIMEKQVRQPPTPPRELNPLLPIAMSDLILALLAKSPDDRPASCGVVQKMLAAVPRQKSAPQAPAIPPLAEPQSNAEIAKGLIRSYSRRTKRVGERAWIVAKPYAIDLPMHWLRQASSWMREHLSEKLDTPGMRSVMTVAALLFIWIILGLIFRHDQGPVPTPKSAQEQSLTKPEAVSSTPTAVPATPSPSKAQGQQKPATTTKAAGSGATGTQAPTRKETTATSATPDKKAEPAKPTPRSVTYSVSSRVVRSDGSHAGQRDRHEFRGGSRLFFTDELPADAMHGKIQAYKSGWIRLYLRKTVHLSAIVIHKASVGRKSFVGGEIEMDVRDSRGHWTEVLSRKGRDIDTPIRIRGPRKALAEVKGIRLRFTTPQPITIGPIDLLP